MRALYDVPAPAKINTFLHIDEQESGFFSKLANHVANLRCQQVDSLNE